MARVRKPCPAAGEPRVAAGGEAVEKTRLALGGPPVATDAAFAGIESVHDSSPEEQKANLSICTEADVGKLFFAGRATARKMCSGAARSGLRRADDGGRVSVVRTRLSICARKVRYGSEAEAAAAARGAGLALRAYRCDRCGRFHLTSRTKGKRIPRPAGPGAAARSGRGTH